MKIYVIRHGLTALNIARKINGEIDEPLVPEGIRQAKAIISDIPKSIRYIYCSPLLRARQTAEVISTTLEIPIVIADELTEIRMGKLVGKSWEEMDDGLELRRQHRAVQFDYRQYGGESLEEVKKRLLSFLKKINKKSADSQVLLVTHGGIIRVINLIERGEPLTETVKHVSLLKFDLDKILN